jgi:molybdate transport system substrate-binding protein
MVIKRFKASIRNNLNHEFYNICPFRFHGLSYSLKLKSGAKICKNLIVFQFFALCLLIAGCGKVTDTSSTPKDSSVTLTVSVAQSLKQPMEDVKQIYQKESKSSVIFNFGSSGSLQQQIEQGAPVDVFISAAKKQMDALQSKTLLVNSSRRDLLGNKVVLIIPQGTTGISKFNDLTKKEVERIALGEPASVPVGQYAQEVLNFLKINDKIKSKYIYGKDVRQVLTYVETKSVNAGIVYQTDARQSNKVTVVSEAPKNSHSPIIYPVAVLKNSQNIKESEKFVQFLLSAPVSRVFEKYGFTKAVNTSSN